jgi:hypothetical protein
MIKKTGKVGGYNEAGRTNVGNTKGISGVFAMLFPNHYLEMLVRYAICHSPGVFLPEVGGG